MTSMISASEMMHMWSAKKETVLNLVYASQSCMGMGKGKPSMGKQTTA